MARCQIGVRNAHQGGHRRRNKLWVRLSSLTIRVSATSHRTYRAMAARIRLPRASCGDRRQAELAGVADHIAGMLAGDRNQRIHGGIAILGLDDHAVHDRIVRLHLRQRLGSHAPLPEGVAIGGQRGDINAG